MSTSKRLERAIRLSAAALVCVAVSVLSSAAPAFSATNGDVRYIATCDSAESVAQLRQASASAGVTSIVSPTDSKVVYLQGAEDSIQASAARSIQAEKIVAFQQDHRVHVSAYIPNDPQLGSQWGMSAVRATDAWVIGQASPSVRIAIVDTGVDLNHPDLAAAVDIEDDRDFQNGDYSADDDNGHGTGVAGIAAAVADNGIGVAGLGAGATILPIKVMDQNGSGWESTVADGVRYAADHGANIINLSLGGPSPSQYFSDALKYATDKGCVVVAASGNDGNTQPYYPASYSHAGIIGVAAVTSTLNRAHWSNYGGQVDIAAPGVNILSAATGGGYGTSSGTSEATPFVSGACALILSQQPGLAVSKLKAILQTTAIDRGAAGRDDEYGYGVLDARTALAYRSDTAGPTTSISGVSSNWARNSATVAFSAKDSGTGVKATLYKLNAGSELDYTAPITISTEGTTAITYRSTDRANHAEKARTAYVRIDTVPPVVTARADIAAGHVVVSLAASDAMSGIDATYYRIDGGTWKTGNTVDVSANGFHQVEYYTVDVAGNSSSNGTTLFTVNGGSSEAPVADNTAPVTTASGATGQWRSKVTTLALSAADSDSAVRETWWRLNSGPRVRYAGSPISIGNQGISRISFWSVDASGNFESPKQVEVWVDRTAPSTPGAAGWSLIGSHQVALTWRDASDSDSGVASYRVYDKGALVLRTSATTATFTGLSAGSTHSYQIQSVDGAGNLSSLSSAQSVAIPGSEQHGVTSTTASQTATFKTVLAGSSGRLLQVGLSAESAAADVLFAESSTFPHSAPSATHFLGRCMSLRAANGAVVQSLSIPIDSRISTKRMPQLKVVQWRDNGWQPVEAVVSASSRTIDCTLSDLSPIAVIEPKSSMFTSLFTNRQPVVSYGSSLTLSARLADHFADPLKGRKLKVERLSGSKWIYVGTMKEPSAGLYKLSVRPGAYATTYRITTSSSTFQNGAYVRFKVMPKAYLSRPSVSRASAGVILVQGRIKPVHSGKITLIFQQYASGTWTTAWTSQPLSISSTGTYRIKAAAGRGIWRVKATHSCSRHASSSSGYSASINLQ